MAEIEITKRVELKEGLQYPIEELDDRQKSIIEWTGNEFDKRVHIVDPKSGKLLKYQPYRREVIRGETVYYRRDARGVEQRYNENGYCLDQHKEEVRAKNDKKSAA